MAGSAGCLFMFSGFSVQSSKVVKCLISNGSRFCEGVLVVSFVAPEIMKWCITAVFRCVLLICFVLRLVDSILLINSWLRTRYTAVCKMGYYEVPEADMCTLLSPKHCGMYVKVHKHRRLALGGLSVNSGKKMLCGSKYRGCKAPQLKDSINGVFDSCSIASVWVIVRKVTRENY